MLLMIWELNNAELESLYSILLPTFYVRFDKNQKKKLKESFKDAYNDIKS